MIEIHISNRQHTIGIDPAAIEAAVRGILADHDVADGEISIAIVDDTMIRALNRRHLGHDYVTDTLSFLLVRTTERLEGEVIVSADRAKAVAPEYGWDAADELRLYIVHGTLHLVGYDDNNAADRDEMRRQEQHYLTTSGGGPSAR